MKQINHEKIITLTKSDLLKEFKKNYKQKEDFKIGIELERLVIHSNSGEIASYYGENGICKLLFEFAQQNKWEHITDSGHLIGLKKGKTTITLEPGAQLEISLESKKAIKEIEKDIEQITKKIKESMKPLGLDFIATGVSPTTTYSRITIIPKARYHIMNKNLSGDMLYTMMRETAGIQTTVDFCSEEDAIKKLKLSLMMSPVMTAIFANSPIYNRGIAKYKSYRALAWLFTDNKRCGLINSHLLKKESDFGFNDYINAILDVPMLFIVRNGNIIEINKKINFKEYMEKGFEGFYPTLEDFKLQESLFFPEVRLREYIEIRNHDCQSGNLKYAVPAIYKGILYSENAMDACFDIFSCLRYQDFILARENVPKYSIEANLGKYKIREIAQEILNIAYYSLKKEKNGEAKYIEQIMKLIQKGKTPADIIIDKFGSTLQSSFNNYLKYIKD